MRLLIPALCCLFFLNTNAQQPGTDYRLYDTRQHREVAVKDIADGIKAGEVLVFGEQHDDSIGHLMELKVLEALHAAKGPEVILSMEMFQRDVQYILDEYLAGIISEKNFIKEARAWDTYKTDYKPCVEFAKEKGLKVVAANAPSRYTNLVTRKGLNALALLSKEVKKRYLPPLPIDTVTGLYYERFLATMGGHSMPGMNLYQSQNVWDATMSWSIAQALKEHKKAVVLMLNGRFHSDEHLGLVKRLEVRYGKKATTISSFAGALENIDWKQYEALGDYILLTREKEKEAQPVKQQQ